VQSLAQVFAHFPLNAKRFEEPFVYLLLNRAADARPPGRKRNGRPDRFLSLRQNVFHL